MDEGEKRNMEHPPLRRLSNTSINYDQSNHTLIYLTNSTPSTIYTNTLSMPLLESSPDSCYSSSSETGSHPSLSREPSDSTLLKNTLATGQDSLNSLTASNTEFATKLGYSPKSIQIVLQSLGSDASQDEVLYELIKLGKSGRQGLHHKQNSMPQVKNTWNPSSSTFFLNFNSSNSAMTKKDLQPELRPIVIDGSNLAMHHGCKAFFSCQGIRVCVDFFAQRGHTEIYVFVPQYRREVPRADSPVYNQQILFDLENEKRLIWTPSRRINGRRIVCHDDRYILKTAAEKDGIIVSNDEYRDLVREHPEYKQMIAQRLLMYSFVDGKFMPPEDPLGKRGPKLDRFLQIGPPFTMQPCPYAKKCTYGNKCKYFHAERLNGAHISTTERLFNKTGAKKQSLSAKSSMINEQQRWDQPDKNLQFGTEFCDKLTRTRSLNFSPNWTPDNQTNQSFNNYVAPNQNNLLQPMTNLLMHDNMSNDFAPIMGFVDEQRALFNRYVSVSLNNQPKISSSCFDSPSSSNSDQPEHSFSNKMFQSFSNQNQLQMFTPHVSSSLLGSGEQATSTECHLSLHEVRQRIKYNLSQIFPESSVIAVLNAHPNETNAQRLCQRLLAFQDGFNS